MTSPALNKKKPGQSAAPAPAPAPSAAPKNAWAQGAPKVGSSAAAPTTSSPAPTATTAIPGLAKPQPETAAAPAPAPSAAPKNAWAQGAPKVAGPTAAAPTAAAPKPTGAAKPAAANPFRGTNMSDDASMKYHHKKHGAGASLQEYCADAAAFAASPTGRGRPMTLADGSVGTKYSTPGGPGGIIDADGKVITYWYGDD